MKEVLTSDTVTAARKESPSARSLDITLLGDLELTLALGMF